MRRLKTVGFVTTQGVSKLLAAITRSRHVLTIAQLEFSPDVPCNRPYEPQSNKPAPTPRDSDPSEPLDNAAFAARVAVVRAEVREEVHKKMLKRPASAKKGKRSQVCVSFCTCVLSLPQFIRWTWILLCSH